MVGREPESILHFRDSATRIDILADDSVSFATASSDMPCDRGPTRRNLTQGIPIAVSARMTPRFAKSRREMIGCIAMTIVVGCGMGGTILFVCGALNAVDHMNRVEETLNDLSRYVVEGHASIRGRVITLGHAEDAMVRFDAGMAHRLAQVRSLNTLLAQPIGAYFWTAPLRREAGARQFEEEQRAYVTAAATAATDPGLSLRLFDLRAQKLIQTIEAERDSTASAKTRALVAAESIVALSTGLGALLIVCLIWHPVTGRARLQMLPTLRA
jgi:hypothetical protein